MATSLRLLIIKALDSLTSTAAGVSWFVGEHQSGDSRETSGYQRLLDIALTKQVEFIALVSLFEFFFTHV